MDEVLRAAARRIHGLFPPGLPASAPAWRLRRDRLWHRVAHQARRARDSRWASVLCAAAREELPRVAGATISLHGTGGAERLLAASDEFARACAQAQYTLGEGPGSAACLANRPVLVDDVTAEGGRWPGFVDTAARLGVGAVFAFPLRFGGHPVGCLQLHARQPGNLTEDELLDAAALADISGVALAEDVDGALVEQLTADAREDLVNIATGVVAAQLAVSVAESSARLRAYAFAHDRPLLEVAADISAFRLSLASE